MSNSGYVLNRNSETDRLVTEEKLPETQENRSKLCETKVKSIRCHIKL